MKIELKNIKYAAFASEETHCYNASLYIDGKKIGTVSNDGHGGCDMFHGDYEAKNKVEAWLKDNGNHDTYHDGSTMFETLEMRCCDLVNEWHRKNEVKKILRRVSYTKGDGIYQLPAKYKPTPEVLAHVKTAKWWTTDCVMLNELSIDEVAQYL